MSFNFSLDLGVILASAIQGAATGAATAVAVMIVTRPLKKLIEGKNNKAREEREEDGD